MNDYLVTVSEEGAAKTAYKIVDAYEFFKLINEWLDFDNEPNCNLQIIQDDFNQMVLVDGCDDTKICYGVDGAAVTFANEEEIRATVERYVKQSEKVDLNFPKTIH